MVSFGILGAVDGVYYQLVVIGSLENFSFSNVYVNKIENMIYVSNALGSFLVAGASFYFTTTDNLLLFFAIIGFIFCIPLLIFFKESVYFSMKNGRVSKALYDLRNIYLCNHPKIKKSESTDFNFCKNVGYPIEKLRALVEKVNPYQSEASSKNTYKGNIEVDLKFPNMSFTTAINPFKKNLQIKVTEKATKEVKDTNAESFTKLFEKKTLLYLVMFIFFGG